MYGCEENIKAPAIMAGVATAVLVFLSVIFPEVAVFADLAKLGSVLAPSMQAVCYIKQYSGTAELKSALATYHDAGFITHYLKLSADSRTLRETFCYQWREGEVCPVLWQGAYELQ
jgi:hypothetical protein